MPAELRIPLHPNGPNGLHEANETTFQMKLILCWPHIHCQAKSLMFLTETSKVWIPIPHLTMYIEKKNNPCQQNQLQEPSTSIANH